jgi:hypothetical protein
MLPRFNDGRVIGQDKYLVAEHIVAADHALIFFAPSPGQRNGPSAAVTATGNKTIDAIARRRLIDSSRSARARIHFACRR